MTDAVVQLNCGVKVSPSPRKPSPIHILIGLIQNDPWGKQGKDSLAGMLWSKTPGHEGVKDSQTYSEVSLGRNQENQTQLTGNQMWMGTYPTNPSYVLSTGELLSDYIKKNPQLVGRAVLDRFGPEIPYLPKVREESWMQRRPSQC